MELDLKCLSSIYRGAPFWAWNGKLEPNELRRQIRIMHKMGLGGFFMHSRVGLDTPYLSEEWFNCINACCDEAKKLNMLAYLYDEDRWPSGAAGGIVTKDKKYRMRHLVMLMTKEITKIKWRKNTVGIFIVNFEGKEIKSYRKIKKNEKIKDVSPSEKILIFNIEISKESEWYNGATYLDTLNPEGVKKFIEVTHQNYKKYCGKYFGSVIPGIFTDEPNYGGVYSHYHWPPQPEGYIYIPWTDKLSIIFKNRYGYDILEHLPEIYFDIKGKNISKVRYHYFDCITHLFVESFAKQIGDWCEKNKILFTGHVLCEDTLSSQTSVVGNCMRFYQYMQAPGMDLLTEHWRIFNTAKQVSSVARQFNRKWRLTETYGCTGWDFPFSGHKALGDWQIALGINLRCQHLSWYTMLGEAKRDYPASIFYQSPWWELYKYVEDYFARVHLVMTKGEEIRDLLVIHPIESMWAIYKMPDWNEKEKKYQCPIEREKLDEMFAEMCDILLSTHIDFDYGDEEILSKWAKIENEGKDVILKVNKGKYKAVLVPPLYTIRSSTIKILQKFKEMGGKVIFVEKFPQYIDAETVEFPLSNFELVPSFKDAVEKLKEKTKRISITDENGNEIGQILYLLREDENAFYLFLCNTSMEWKNKVWDRGILARERNIKFENVVIRGIPTWKYPIFEIDPNTGKIYSVESIKEENGYIIKTSFPALGSRLFIIPKKKLKIPVVERKKLKEVKRDKIKKELWEVRLSEENVVVLDKPSFKIEGNNWQTEKEILKIDRDIRKYLGLPPRGGSMVQPWARKKEKKQKTIKVSLKYLFNVEKIPSGEVSIAIEKPSLYNIWINGYEISKDMVCGWWVDKSLEKIKFDPSILKTGKNEIILETNYNQEHPGFEIIYLLGNFGVRLKNEEISICEPVNYLKIGDWTEQGLPFYSGCLSYIHQMKSELKENERLFVEIPEYMGVGVRIFVDEIQAGIIAWPPNSLDITDYISGKENFILKIEILGHRRNSHGPFHWYEKWPIWTGPGQFISEGKEWFEGYQIVPCGLMKEPEIVIYKQVGD